MLELRALVLWMLVGCGPYTHLDRVQLAIDRAGELRFAVEQGPTTELGREPARRIVYGVRSGGQWKIESISTPGARKRGTIRIAIDGTGRTVIAQERTGVVLLVRDPERGWTEVTRGALGGLQNTTILEAVDSCRVDAGCRLDPDGEARGVSVRTDDGKSLVVAPTGAPLDGVVVGSARLSITDVYHFGAAARPSAGVAIVTLTYHSQLALHLLRDGAAPRTIELGSLRPGPTRDPIAVVDHVEDGAEIVDLVLVEDADRLVHVRVDATTSKVTRTRIGVGK